MALTINGALAGRLDVICGSSTNPVLSVDGVAVGAGLFCCSNAPESGGGAACAASGEYADNATQIDNIGVTIENVDEDECEVDVHVDLRTDSAFNGKAVFFIIIGISIHYKIGLVT